MNTCLDTDTVIEYLKNNPAVVARVNSAPEKLLITPITVLELFYGAYRSDRVAQRTKEVQELLHLFPVLSFTTEVYEHFGQLKADLQRKGLLIDNFDLVIASFCRAYGCILVTNNTKHFIRISGLCIENWMTIG